MFELSALDSSNALFWILLVTVQGSLFCKRRKVQFILFHPCFVQRHRPHSLPYHTLQREMTPVIEIQTLDMILLVSVSLFSFSSTPFTF